MEEELSPTAKRLRDEHAKRSHKAASDDSKTVQSKTWFEIAVTLKFLQQFGRALLWLWWNVGSPVLNVFTIPLFKRLFKWYVALWKKHTTYRDEFGNEKFSRKRGAVMVAMTLLVPAFLFNMALLTLDTSIYAVTKEEKTVWLSLPQEIYPGANIFSVQGCIVSEDETTTVHCSEDNSLYYRVRPTLFSELWSLTRGWSMGRPFELFYPDLIVSPVGASWSKCNVVTYSFRIKILMGLGDIYPELLHAECERST